MVEERRSASRILTAGVRVVYELASGERVEAAAEDLSSTGLFVQTVRNLAVGKRIALEIHVPGEAAPWSAVGRVVWVRGEAEAATAGMGVKFIDIDEAASIAFEKMRTREVSPLVEDGAAEIDLVGPTLPFKLSTRKVAATPEPHPKSLSSPPPRVKASTGWNWVAICVIAVVAGLAVYVILARATSGARGGGTAPQTSVPPALAPQAPLPAAVARVPSEASAVAIPSAEPPSPTPVHAPSTAPSASNRPAPSTGPTTGLATRPIPRSPSSGDAAPRVPPPQPDDSSNPY